MEYGYEEWFTRKVAQRVTHGDARYVPLTQTSPMRVAAEVLGHLEEQGEEDDSCFAILISFEMLAHRSAILAAVASNAPEDWQLERSDFDNHQHGFRVTFTCRKEVDVRGAALEPTQAGHHALVEFLGDMWTSARVTQKTICVMVWTGNEDDMQSEHFDMVGALGLNPAQQHIWDSAVQQEGEKSLLELLRGIQDGGAAFNEPQQANWPSVPEFHHILDKPGR